MDTKPLERFATQTRRDLLAAVDAQATAVLAPGSVARTERGEVVKKLEAEITAHGRAHVIDTVAYTWFNRIIALRFMDARGYTDAGVVSPAQGQAHGQPEILADAKRGNLNTDVVSNKNTAEEILGLLDGTRRSTDAEGEAYALLLTEYCHHWHKSMPFMFEPEGDYTELLVPTGLLADGAILSQARAVLTEEVCDDVEVIGWLYQFYISERKAEVFAGFKKNKKAGADEIPAATQLFTPHWIVRYLVENSLGRLWMLNRPTSHLVDQMDYYITPVDEETNFLKINGPEELTMIDPACGSGHMLTYAFELLYAIYVEEGYAPSDIPSLILTHNLHGTEIDPRAGSLAAFALTMKARARQRTFFSMRIEPKICVLDPISFTPDEIDFLYTKDGDRQAEEAFWNQFAEAGILGALIRSDPDLAVRLANHLDTLGDGGDMFTADLFERADKVVRQSAYLTPNVSVVVANPPYMGKRNMDPRVADYLARTFPEAAADLYLGFFMRAMKLVVPGGFAAQVAMRGWLHAAAQAGFRRHLLARHAIVTLMPMDNKVMPIDFETAAVVWSVGAGAGTNRIATHEVSRADLDPLDVLPPSPFHRIGSSAAPSGEYLRNESAEVHFDLEDFELQLLSERDSLQGVACKVGLQTGDVPRFVRFWHEVSTAEIATCPADPRRWAPYAKAGGARRWYGFTDYLVNWADGGRDIKANPSARPQGVDNYWRIGLEWSDIGHHDIAVRMRPAGYIFDVVAMSLFVDGDDQNRLYGLLAYLNSSVAGNLMNSLSSGLHYSVGYVAKLPEPDHIPEVIVQASKRNVSLSMNDWNQRETSRGFVTSPLVAVSKEGQELLANSVDIVCVAQAISKAEMASNDRLIDEHFANDMGAQGAVMPDRRIEGIEPEPVASLVAAMVSYAVGCMFGRYSLDEPGLILADQGATLQDYLARVPSPTFRPDADNVIPFVDDGWFEDDIVERFRQFLRAAFGAERFEENLRFVEDSLGVKTLRDYFITKAGKSKFYDDHVQRYKKRPIYWMFSSPKGSFNALIYMHRYNLSTVPTVLNEYLREYRAKLEVALTNAEHAAAAGSAKDQKEADRLRKVLSELRGYEHDVLYPLATQQLVIDLDDGVRANYPKFYPALRKITGLEVVE